MKLLSKLWQLFLSICLTILFYGIYIPLVWRFAWWNQEKYDWLGVCDGAYKNKFVLLKQGRSVVLEFNGCYYWVPSECELKLYYLCDHFYISNISREGFNFKEVDQSIRIHDYYRVHSSMFHVGCQLDCAEMPCTASTKYDNFL